MRNTHKAFTLIETIIFIVVLGVALTPLSILVVNVTAQNTYSQAHATAVALAEGEMDRILNLSFSSINDEAQTAFSAPYSVYRWQTIVDYVDPTDLNTPVDPAVTNYKRVRIIVDSSTNILLGNSIILTTVATNTL
jgi:Tfp pilus assembly protein PilV